jgi:hypothetical protein
MQKKISGGSLSNQMKVRRFPERYEKYIKSDMKISDQREEAILE